VYFRRVVAGLICAVCVAGCARLPYPPSSGSPSSTSTPTVSLRPTPTRSPGSSASPTPSSSDSGLSTGPLTGTNTSSSTPQSSESAENPGGYPTAADPGVVISWNSQDAASVSLSASIPGVVEVDGQCLATAVQADTTRTAQVATFPDAQSTVCEPITVSGLSPGEWTITVTYTSTDHQLTSAPLKVSL
jgi:hypothetical protein